MNLRQEIKEVVREMILDGEIDLRLINVNDYYRPTNYKLVISVIDENEEEKHSLWGGVETKDVVRNGIS